MWTKIFTIFAFTLPITRCETEDPSNAFSYAEKAPEIERYVSEGVRSLGYKVIYGKDLQFSMVNEVVQDMEKPKFIKSQIERQRQVKTLPAADVKCLTSDDHYCSNDMGQMKSVLIQVVKEDCVKCSKEEKEAAAKVIMSLMANHHAAWKLFLTQHLGNRKAERILG